MVKFSIYFYLNRRVFIMSSVIGLIVVLRVTLLFLCMEAVGGQNYCEQLELLNIYWVYI